MDIRTKKYWIVAAATFVIIFLMNYIGNHAPDKLQTALLIATGGVIGLTIGMWFMNKKGKKENSDFDFD